MTRRVACLLALLWAGSDPTSAEDTSQSPAAAMLSPGQSFAETAGGSLYANICQGCHLQDGRGASGAGTYPSLARDGNLAGAGFVVGVVVKGLRSMPAFGRSLSDDQVAAVSSYVRTHFGNAYTDPILPRDVSEARR